MLSDFLVKWSLSGIYKCTFDLYPLQDVWALISIAERESADFHWIFSYCFQQASLGTCRLPSYSNGGHSLKSADVQSVTSDSKTPGSVNYFPTAAIMNYHKFCGLTQHFFKILHYINQKPDMDLSGIKLSLAGCIYFCRLLGRFCFLPFSSF